MKEIKEILNKLWKAIVKHLLSKTTLDEKVAEKVESVNKKVKSIDDIDQTK